MTARMIAGLIALDALLLAVGMAVLYGLGLVRSRWSALRFVGLALFAGWALIGIGGSLAAVWGAALAAWEIVVISAAIAAGAVVLSRRVPAARLGRSLRERGWAAWVAAAGAAVLLVYLEALFRRGKLQVSTAWDAQAFWIPKAAAIVFQGGIKGGAVGWPGFANPDYPPLAPVQDAIAFRFMGRVAPAGLPLQHWVIAVAFLGAVAGLLAGRVRPLLLWPGLALLALMPSFGDLVGSSLGDEPLALLLALAGVCGALWLLDRDARYLVVCGICTSAAAITKVEGLPGALLVALLLLAATRFRPWRQLLPLVAVPVFVDLPWRHWLSVHHISSNSAFPYSKLLDPGYLSGRAGRLGTALVDLPGYLFSLDRWLLAVPVALLLAALLVRRRSDLALLVFGTAVLAFLGNAAIYWISPLPLDWYIQTSAPRVVSSTVLFCAAVAPLLLSEALVDRH